jgi:hypothetical protein
MPVQFDTTLCKFEDNASVPTSLPKGFMNYFDHSYPLGHYISITDWLDSASLKRLEFFPFIPTAITVDVVKVIGDDRNRDYILVGLGREDDGKKLNTYFGWIAVRKEVVRGGGGYYSIKEDDAF